MTDKSHTLAKMLGDKSYDGVSCKLCGQTLRYTVNRACVECAKVRSRQQYDPKRITKA